MENRKITLPKFYDEIKNAKQHNETDHGYETIQDFNLRWLILCADDRYNNAELIHEYAKRAVFLLIYGKNNAEGEYSCEDISDEFKITNVKVRRQWHFIDMVVEIDIEQKSVSKKYLLNIENKYYSSVSHRQLTQYKEIIGSYPNVRERGVIHLCILCDDCKKEAALKVCEETGYKLLTMENIKSFAMTGEETDNYLFDEYWFNFY